jgi:hypothetical protein
VKLVKTFALLAVLGMASAASAQTTLLLDSFDDNSRTDGVAQYDTDWFTTNLAGTNLTVAGNQMTLAGPTVNATFIGAFANDASQALAEGDSLELAFNFAFSATPTAALAGFRFGLFNSDGALVSSDNGSVDDNNDGYFAIIHTNGAGSNLKKETGTDVSPLQGNDSVNVGSPSASSPALGTASHLAQLVLTRTGSTSIQLELLLDGALQHVLTDTAASGNFLMFNEVAIGRGGISQAFSVDNVTVTYYAVPEPASLSLLGLGGLALLRRRRA